jgi:hypothetical protein
VSDGSIIDAPEEHGLPGHELVSAGLADLAAGRESESSLLIAMAAPRLRRLGFDVPEGGGGGGEGGGERPSHRLYELLSATDQADQGAQTDQGARGAHSRYNALIARVVSFARAAEREQSAPHPK